MKTLLLTINLTFIVLGAISQNNINPVEIPESREKQIQNAIQSGRDQIVREIIEGNHNVAIDILQQLRKDYGKNYVVLYPREEMLVALSTRNFKTFTDSALVYNPVIDPGKNGFFYKDFRDELFTYMLPEIMQISQELEQSDLPGREKAILRIYIHFLFSDNISALNNEINEFEKKYSRKIYSDFLNSLKRVTINSRINFSVGYCSESIGGKVTESFYNQLNTIKIELDGFVRKTYVSLFIGGGFGNKTGGYAIKGEDDEIIKVDGEKVSSQKYGLKLGRILYSSEKVKLYSYVSVGAQDIGPKSVLYEETDQVPDDVLKITSLFAGGGASCDIMLKKWKPKHMYDPEGYFFLRPTVGYDRLLTKRDISKFNNFYFSISLGVGIGPKK